MNYDIPAPLIYQKIIAVMKSIEAIGKSRKNQQQGYNFRGIDDVYNELHYHLAQHGVFTVPEVIEERTEDRTTSKGSALIYRVLKIKFVFYAEDGSSVTATVIGEGMDSGDKATNKAMSVAHKYALMQIFAIPTSDLKDPENDSYAVSAQNQIRKAPPRTSAFVFDKNDPSWINKIKAKLGDIPDITWYADKLHGREIVPGLIHALVDEKNKIDSEVEIPF